MARATAAVKELRARLAARDREARAGVTTADLRRIDAAEREINQMPQARALREAAVDWTIATKRRPVDSEDSATREANRALLDAAVHFVRALRGEE